MDRLVRSRSIVSTAIVALGLLVVPGAVHPAQLQEAHCDGPACPTDMAGHSIRLSSGEVQVAVEDLHIRGRGLDFSWVRTYRSRTGPVRRAGTRWDYSYDRGVRAVDADPGEVRALRFDDKDSMTWDAPLDSGGAPGSLTYCTQRSPLADWGAAGVTWVETDGTDLVTTDGTVPPPGGVLFYLVSAKNGQHVGPLGATSAGSPRAGLLCGVQDVPDLDLFEGDGRNDRYVLKADGSWSAREFFRDLVENPDLTYTLMLADGESWRFHALDGSPSEGMIDSISDRNGNALSFAYDPAGRLSAITDTLGRTITVDYNANGLIDAVTDFTGRQVSYAYYDGVQPGGMWGDLESVTGPAVTGTPTGNDFPLGKTTVYTYTTGFLDDTLNHELLTITDPKGQTSVQNVYSSSLDPAALDYGRIVRQVWGDPGDAIDLTYVAVAPSAGNGSATLKVIVNDRVGNVGESLFDDANRLVVRRRYTGRADPDLPTTETTNRPVGQLRVDDPAYFETRWTYNADSQVVQTTAPNLDVESFAYDDTNPTRRLRGNLTGRCRNPGPLGGAQAQICESYEYQAGFGDTRGGEFATRIVDGRGHETLQTFDAAGNCTQTTHRVPSVVEDREYNAFGQMKAHVLPDNGSGYRRRDEFDYYAGGPQTGYLHSRVVDALGLALTTGEEYDAVGNVVREVDPRGNDRLITYNQLDQVVRTRSEPGPAGARFTTDIVYDANDNVVRVDVDNLGDQGTLQANETFTTITEYDVLDYPVRSCRESGAYTAAVPGPLDAPSCAALPAAEFVSTEMGYDANRNRTVLRSGEAVEGRQAANVESTEYDERDLVFRRVRAPGSPVQSTTQLDYDVNGNLKRWRQGLEDGVPRVWLQTFDGYNRLLTTTDPMGNVTTRAYDANDNLTGRRLDGETTDLPDGSANVRLSQTDWTYDEMDRLTREDRAFFDTLSQAAIGDGSATTEFHYSDASQRIETVDDNGHVSATAYDTANRPASFTDAGGNTTVVSYDANSNAVTTTVTEHSDTGAPDQVFTTQNTYDALDRMIRSVDSAGNTTDYGYDSRGNRTSVVDARRASPAGPGNVTRYEYDGLDRLISTTRSLTTDGTGGGLPAGAIVTTRTWDDSARLVGETDGDGNPTLRSYDPLDRLISETFADGTSRGYSWDVHGNRCEDVDAVGTHRSCTFDLLDRLTGRTIDRASVADGNSVDVLGTTAESYQYDGLSRLVVAADDDSSVSLAYDSLSHLTGETLNGATTSSVFDGVGNELVTTYPSGLVVTRTFDALDRERSVADPDGIVATFDFTGPRREERRQYRNGSETLFSYDGDSTTPNPPGDAGVRRVVDTLHTIPDTGAIIDHRAYAWNEGGEKTRITRLEPGSLLDRGFDYDSAGRLVHASEDGAPTDYTLDGTGNRLSVVGGPEPGAYVLDPAAPEPADAQMNQYTATPADARAYDENGNLISRVDESGVSTRHYDFRDQLVSAGNPVTGQTTTFAYDAFGRRISTTVDGLPPHTVFYFYDQRGVCEEQGDDGTTQASYIGAPLAAMSPVGGMVLMRRGPADSYYHGDDMGNTVAVTDGDGNVVERYEYGDFGKPTILDGLGVPILESAIGNPYLFAVGRHENGAGPEDYYDGTRYLDADTGRYTTRCESASCVAQVDAGGADKTTEASDRPFNPPPWLPDDVAAWIKWMRDIHDVRERQGFPPLPSDKPDWGPDRDVCDWIWKQIEGIEGIEHPSPETEELAKILNQAWKDWCVTDFLKRKYPNHGDWVNRHGPPQSVKAYSDTVGQPWTFGELEVHSEAELRELIKKHAAYGLIRRFEFVTHGPDEPVGPGGRAVVDCGSNVMDLDALADMLRGKTKRGDCRIILTICNAGTDREGVQRLADATGCVVEAYTEKINRWTEGAFGDKIEVHPRQEHGP